MQQFKGRTAVVTGAGSGIGKALAERFAAEGMNLVLADVQQAALQEVADQLSAQGTQVVAQLTDVSSAEAVQALADAAWDRFGAVHLLCNNAGIVPGARFRPIWETPIEDWQWSLNVNLMGIVHGIRAFIPRMLTDGQEGHIVNTISVAGLVSGANSPAYGAAKHAALRATEALYTSLRDNGSQIGVTALCPGVVLTGISQSERNRPAALIPKDGVKGDDVTNLSDYAAVKAAGLTPAQVADITMDAIRARQFYAVTTTAFDAGVRERMESILTRKNPEFLDIMAMSKDEVRARA